MSQNREVNTEREIEKSTDKGTLQLLHDCFTTSWNQEDKVKKEIEKSTAKGALQSILDSCAVLGISPDAKRQEITDAYIRLQAGLRSAPLGSHEAAQATAVTTAAYIVLAARITENELKEQMRLDELKKQMRLDIQNLEPERQRRIPALSYDSEVMEQTLKAAKDGTLEELVPRRVGISPTKR